MPNIRVMPPASGLYNSLTINGRSYSSAPGSTLDVPDFDAKILAGNGWTAVEGVDVTVGPTSQRPVQYPGAAAPGRGQRFIDTTVGAVIVFDGLVWRNTLAGAAV